VVAAIVIAIAIVVGQHLQEEERRRQWLAVAETKGFRFSAEADPALWTAVAPFHLFSQGRSRKIVNVMRTDVDDVSVSLFDYRFTTGSGRHSHTHRQTVALLESERIRLPRFTLRPEGLFHKLGSFLGYQDIDFEAHPQFSDAYLLQGDDEASIREVFADPVLSYYAVRGGLCTEGNGHQVVYYRADRQIPPERIEAFLEEGLGIVRLFCEKDDAPEEMDRLDRFLQDAQSVVESLASNSGG
jgi:hypothetical protein